MNAFDKIVATDALLSATEGRLLFVNVVHTCTLLLTATVTDPVLIYDSFKELPLGIIYCCLCRLENILEMDVKIEKAHTHWKKNCCIIQTMGQDREVNLTSNEFLAKELSETLHEKLSTSPIASFCTVQLYDDFGNTFSSCKNENSHRQFLN
jgi:hypothetical protein